MSTDPEDEAGQGEVGQSEAGRDDEAPGVVEAELVPRDISGQPQYLCADCNLPFHAREELRAHRTGHAHRSVLVRKKMEQLGYVKTRTSAGLIRDTGIPYAVDFDYEGGPSAQTTYVPKLVQQAIEEWLTFPTVAKLGLPLKRYLVAIFADVYPTTSEAKQKLKLVPTALEELLDE